MSLEPGTRLSARYEIKSLLGAGGMGEVYRARDTELHRDVAMKFLPAEVAADHRRMQRFVQEARAASALNHPNILTVYEIGQAGGTHYIVTEFIDGETVRERLARSRLGLREALDISIQVTSALVAAHAKGIVHRDIKPENVMVRHGDGIVKVLDFGLAKLTEQRDAPAVDTEAVTRAVVNTEPGLVIGTAAYMSPEQACGLEVDARSDIFSLGVVLYELVAGRRPFETRSDLMAALLAGGPEPLTRTLPEAPAELHRIVAKALRKDREERYQTSRDLLVDLRGIKQELDFEARTGGRAAWDGSESAPAAGGATGRGTAAPPTSERAAADLPTVSEIFLSEVKQHPKRTTLTLAVVALVLAAAGLGVYKLVSPERRADSFQTMRLSKLTFAGNVLDMEAAVSPDGRYVAYAARDASQQSLWVRQVATSRNIQIIPPAEIGYGGLTFSRDGDYVYYVAAARSGPPALYQIAVLGGPPRKLVEDAGGPATISPDGRRLAFVRGGQALMVANADGTAVETLAARSGGEIWSHPAWSPDGSRIACGVSSPVDTNTRLVEVAVKDGAQRPISSPQWLRLNGMAWLPDGSGLVLSARDLETRLSQVWLLTYPEGKASKVTNDLNSYIGLSLTADGKNLVSVQGDRMSNIWVVPAADASGARRVTAEAGRDEGLSGLSWMPDGRVVYTVRTTGTQDIWVVSQDGSDNRQLTANARSNYSPSVTPDGRHIVFVSNRAGNFGLWRMDADGGNPSKLTDTPGTAGWPQVSPDGRWVAYQLTKDSKTTIWRVPVEGGAPAELIDAEAGHPAFSPDGKFLACGYAGGSADSPARVAIIPAEGGPPTRVLDLPAVTRSPVRWTPDGRALAYIGSRDRVYNIWSRPLDGGPPVRLTDFTADRIYSFEWSRDGKHLALARGRDNADVVLISNFR